MKRDMDLIREILIQIQDHKVAEARSWQVRINGRDPAEVVEHVHLLVERGLVRGVPARSGGYTHYLDPNLTWEGHDFIVSARDDSTWARAKRTILERGGALVFEVLKQTLADLAKGQIPGH
jgi:Hypothetical protein (DUF2513)